MQPENFRILDWQFNSQFTRHFAEAALGFIPAFVSADDIRPAWEQFDEHYIGGWNPALPGKWKLDQHGNLFFPGDPPLVPVAYAKLRDETIYVYQHAWVCIALPDGSFSVARMD